MKKLKFSKKNIGDFIPQFFGYKDAFFIIFCRSWERVGWGGGGSSHITKIWNTDISILRLYWYIRNISGYFGKNIGEMEIIKNS